MATILERYEQKFRGSRKAYESAAGLIPGGGHQSRVVKPFPLFVAEGSGGSKRDVDGNELIDYMMGFGALMLGHAHPEITEAVTNRLAQGTHMGTTSELEIEWARLVRDLIPCAERVRFTASGTESTLLALRLARGFTGRKKLVKFREHFHGWHDYVSMESGINTQVGIPEETMSTVVVLEPEVDALRDLLEKGRRRCGGDHGADGRPLGAVPRRQSGLPGGRPGDHCAARRHHDHGRGDLRLPHVAGRRAGPVRDHARHDDNGEDRGGRPSGRRGGGPGGHPGADGRCGRSAARPPGHLQRQPRVGDRRHSDARQDRQRADQRPCGRDGSPPQGRATRLAQ